MIEVDGHDIEAVADAFYQARWVKPHKPIVIIAHTVKGKGIEQAEFNYKWHTHAPSPEVCDEMIREVCRTYGKPEVGYSRLASSTDKDIFYGGE